MLRTRVIPALLLRDDCLVKTRQFSKFTYVGDPCNTVRIFNELEVDELLFLDISCTPNRRRPNFELLQDISNECFMPLGYGGGVESLATARRIFEIGFEKVALNSAALKDPSLIGSIAKQYGSQAVIASIDYKSKRWGAAPRVWGGCGRQSTRLSVLDWAKQVENEGAGEILLTSIKREGMWSGFDLDMIEAVSDAVSIPVVAHGGAASLEDIRRAKYEGKASAIALGSMVVFQKKDMGVLVNFPEPHRLEEYL